MSLHLLEKLVEWKQYMYHSTANNNPYLAALHLLEKLVEWKLRVIKRILLDDVYSLHLLEKLVEWKLGE